MACKEFVSLNSGFRMPALGFGTWQAVEDELEAAVEEALEAGYRHIDTACIYMNEHVIGKVLKQWLDAEKVKRDDLFIVTKLPVYGNRPDDVEKCLKRSLEKLMLDYVDLYLIHVPFGCFRPSEEDAIDNLELDMTTDYIAIWKEMEKQVDDERTKSIGVSNFNIKQVEKILENSKIPPAINQVEFHVYLQQPELIEFLTSHNVAVTAYSPLGTAGTAQMLQMLGIGRDLPNLLQNPTVLEIAEEVNKTAAQVLLRHIIQKGFIAIPKSTNPERIKQNIDIFDFSLNDEQMSRLNSLDQNLRILHFKDFFPKVEEHPEYPF